MKLRAEFMAIPIVGVVPGVPETHRLLVLERPAGGHGDDEEGLRHESAMLQVHSDHLADHPSVVVASEPLDDSAEWRPLEPGELAHVGPDLAVTSTVVVDHPPAHVLHLHNSTGQERSHE